jgi:hypothetical protein
VVVSVFALPHTGGNEVIVSHHVLGCQEDLHGVEQACDIFTFPAVGELLTPAMREAMTGGHLIVATLERGHDEHGSAVTESSSLPCWPTRSARHSTNPPR